MPGLLSLAQQNQRFLDPWDSGSPANSAGAACRIWGLLDIETLQRGLIQIAQRHPILRSGFAPANGQAIQYLSTDARAAPPIVDFANSLLYANAKLSEWQANGTPRQARVSSFGVGGANAHIILKEAPAAADSSPSRPYPALMFSVKTQVFKHLRLARAQARIRERMNPWNWH
jgi:hypothetical protein